MARTSCNTTHKLKLMTAVPTIDNRTLTVGAVADEFWILKFLCVGIDRTLSVGGSIGVSVTIGGTIVWQVEFPIGMLEPFIPPDFGDGIYNGVFNESLRVSVDAPFGLDNISLSFGYF